MITETEIQIAKHCLTCAIKNGASGARVSLGKNTQDSCTCLNGETEKVSHSADRSVHITIFAKERYGTFSTNRLEINELEEFIKKAVEMTSMLGTDKFRRLPDPDRTAKDAKSGTELGLYDILAAETDASLRLKTSESTSRFKSFPKSDDYEIISEECEYAESIEDTLLIDSNGFEGRHKETYFSVFTEITIKDRDGNKYSGHWWESSVKFDSLKTEDCAHKALQKAVSQINPQKRRSGRYKMIVDNSVSSRLISPLFNALNAQSIQQKMSFLEDSLGKKVFSDGLTIIDDARARGKCGSRMYDYEGVATQRRAIIENGVVNTFFVSTYMSEKTGLQATVDGVSHPVMLPYLDSDNLPERKKDVSLSVILARCGNGIYVTGFNGGNSNPVTGDFSFGIEGFAIKNGKIAHPVREMLITGNIVELWNSLIAVGSDARECSRWQIPSLAFEGVAFSG